MLKFAILKMVKGKNDSVIMLEYDQDQVRSKLIDQTIRALDRSLVGLFRKPKSSWNEQEISQAIQRGLTAIIDDLKDQTVSVC